MKKVEITLSFDEEKLEALEFVLRKEKTTVKKSWTRHWLCCTSRPYLKQYGSIWTADRRLSGSVPGVRQNPRARQRQMNPKMRVSYLQKRRKADEYRKQRNCPVAVRATASGVDQGAWRNGDGHRNYHAGPPGGAVQPDCSGDRASPDQPGDRGRAFGTAAAVGGKPDFLSVPDYGAS